MLFVRYTRRFEPWYYCNTPVLHIRPGRNADRQAREVGALYADDAQGYKEYARRTTR